MRVGVSVFDGVSDAVSVALGAIGVIVSVGVGVGDGGASVEVFAAVGG